MYVVSKEDIERYWEQAKEQEDRYIMIVCDTFSYEDYPVFVKNRKELKQKKK